METINKIWEAQHKTQKYCECGEQLEPYEKWCSLSCCDEVY